MSTVAATDFRVSELEARFGPSPRHPPANAHHAEGTSPTKMSPANRTRRAHRGHHGLRGAVGAEPVDDAANMMWGDVGTLYWMIRPEDLAARRFDEE